MLRRKLSSFFRARANALARRLSVRTTRAYRSITSSFASRAGALLSRRRSKRGSEDGEKRFPLGSRRGERERERERRRRESRARRRGLVVVVVVVEMHGPRLAGAVCVTAHEIASGSH